MPSLDDQFGPVIPGRVRSLERSAELSHVLELDHDLIDLLDAILDSANAFPLFRTLSFSVCLLWAVDRQGEVKVALEEVCEVANPDRKYPRMRQLLLNPDVEALGHPCLVSNFEARIAGELILDEDENGILEWYLSNNSGRFGYGNQREERHLQNVADMFFFAGVSVKLDYIPTR